MQLLTTGLEVRDLRVEASRLENIETNIDSKDVVNEKADDWLEL